jgi:hypothetical protein
MGTLTITDATAAEITVGWADYPDADAYAIVAAAEWPAWFGIMCTGEVEGY